MSDPADAPGSEDADALTFEHLVEVDGTDPAIPPIGAERLWRGLKLRVEFPQNFQPALDRCDLVQLDDGELLRTLHFGQQVVRDRVRVDEAAQHIAVEVLGSVGGLQARMWMQMEQPGGPALWVRFRYAVRSPDHAADSPLSGYVKDAWRQADEETIFRIRQLAATGVLDAQLS